MVWSFGRKKNKEGAAAEANPYAQQPAADPYANQYASPAQSQATLSSTTSSGPRTGGLPSGPSPYESNQAPPPYSAGGPVQQPAAAGRYTNDRFGNADRYGDNRYDTPSNNFPQKPSPYQQSSYGQPPSVASKQSLPYSSSKYSSGVASASTSAQPSPVKQQYPVIYGDNKQSGQFPQDGILPPDQQPGYVDPTEGMSEEDLEVYHTNKEISQTRDESVQTVQRIMDAFNQADLLADENQRMMNEQTDRIGNVRLNLAGARAQAEEATYGVKKLDKLNGSMFKYVGQSKSKAEQEDNIKMAQAQELKQMRQEIRGDMHTSKANFSRGVLGAKGASAKNKFEFEEIIGEDEDESELQKEAFINTQMEMLGNRLIPALHQKALMIGQTAEMHNRSLTRAAEESDRVDDEVRRNNLRIARIQ